MSNDSRLVGVNRKRWFASPQRPRNGSWRKWLPNVTRSVVIPAEFSVPHCTVTSAFFSFFSFFLAFFLVNLKARVRWNAERIIDLSLSNLSLPILGSICGDDLWFLGSIPGGDLCFSSNSFLDFFDNYPELFSRPFSDFFSDDIFYVEVIFSFSTLDSIASFNASRRKKNFFDHISE